MSARLELILGGARSGKSRLAELRVNESSMKKIYIATATAQDKEMAERIELHQKRRELAAPWQLIEEPLHLAGALRSMHSADSCILVDCLTLWLSNCLLAECWESEREQFFTALTQASGRIIFVSNEVGLGVVPMGQITRAFVDASGLLHQQLASHCDRVTMTVAGMSMELKSQE